MKIFLFTHGWEGIDFDTSLCYPKDNESRHVSLL